MLSARVLNLSCCLVLIVLGGIWKGTLVWNRFASSFWRLVRIERVVDVFVIHSIQKFFGANNVVVVM